MVAVITGVCAVMPATGEASTYICRRRKGFARMIRRGMLRAGDPVEKIEGSGPVIRTLSGIPHAISKICGEGGITLGQTEITRFRYAL